MAQPQKEERAILQAIRHGTAPTVVKRQASRGAVPVSADELLEILVCLSTDADPTCSRMAQETLASWSEEKLVETLASPDITADTLAHFAHRDSLPEPILHTILNHRHTNDAVLEALAARLPLEQIEKMASEENRLDPLPKFVGALIERQDLPNALRDKLEDLHLEQAQKLIEQPEAEEAPVEEEDHRERVSLTQKIARMTVSERVQCALKGSKDERLILIRSPSKVVYRAVLQSPKIGDSEVESYATMKNVAEEVLRIIANNRKFIKSYVVVRNLVNNPRTPIDVSLTLLNRLTEQDVRFLSKNRNVPDTLRTMALKLAQTRKR